MKVINVQRTSYPDPENEEKYKNLKREIQNLSIVSKITSGNESNVVDFYGFCLHEGEAWICMEYMETSLSAFYLRVHKERDNPQKFPEDLLGLIAVKILNGIAFLKANKIMHRDIKPQNVLLNIKGQIKICDFGVSNILTGHFVVL